MLSPKHFRQFEAAIQAPEIRNLQEEIEDLRSRISDLGGRNNLRLRKRSLTQEILLRRDRIETSLAKAYSRLQIPKLRTEFIGMDKLGGFVSFDMLGVDSKGFVNLEKAELVAPTEVLKRKAELSAEGWIFLPCEWVSTNQLRITDWGDLS